MDNNDESNKDEKSFGKSDSFEHMIAMQEQIFNPPMEETTDAPVTDFSSFGGDEASVNDISERNGAKTENKEEESKEEEKVEDDYVDSRSEEEMHSLFSDPSAGTTQDVDPEEKKILDEERRERELFHQEDVGVTIPPREEKPEEPAAPAATEEKKEESAE